MLEHEPEQLAAGLDAAVLPLVADLLGVEQRLVQLEDAAAQLGDKSGGLHDS